MSKNKYTTLFLDRDGVINKPPVESYAKKWEDFIFNEGSLEAIRIVSKLFDHIIIVTNQQGIGKKLHTVDDLELIHANMLHEIQAHGGRIDKIYYAPLLASEDTSYRKPFIGMALHAQKDFPEIDFLKSIMVGDSQRDIEFGKKVGMKTVLIANEKLYEADENYSSLIDFAKNLTD